MADGFVLAGGQSTRMGQDKSLLTVNGAPLIQHALATLRAAGLEPRIAGARDPGLARFAPVIPDDQANAGLGPLAGICSGLAASTRQYSVFVPVDLPLLPSGLISCLVHYASITQSAVTMVSVAAFPHTFPVVLDRSTTPHLLGALRSGSRKCISAFQRAAVALTGAFAPVSVELLAQAGQVSHPAGLPPHAWFHNVNTPLDLRRLPTSVSALFN